jgi:hypothetical protein
MPNALLAGHANHHRPQCDKVDQHDRPVVPQGAYDEPTDDADDEQIEVPRRPAESRCGVAEDLHDRCGPFDPERKSGAAAQGNQIRRHGSALRRCASSDR